MYYEAGQPLPNKRIKPLCRIHETEIKLRIDDPAKLLALLKKLGAHAHGRVFERNSLYDTPDSHVRHAGCLLRVREESPAAAKGIAPGPARTVLTWKAPAKQEARLYKEKIEQETTTRKWRHWRSALNALGLRRTFQYEKYRTSFRLARVHLDFDETPVGDFLEIEGQPKEIDRAAKRLGFTARDYSRETYWDVYAAHCKQLGKTPQNMLF